MSEIFKTNVCKNFIFDVLGKNYTTDSYVLLHIEDIIDNMHWIYRKFDIHIIYLFYFKFNLHQI